MEPPNDCCLLRAYFQQPGVRKKVSRDCQIHAVFAVCCSSDQIVPSCSRVRHPPAPSKLAHEQNDKSNKSVTDAQHQRTDLSTAHIIQHIPSAGNYSHTDIPNVWTRLVVWFVQRQHRNVPYCRTTSWVGEWEEVWNTSKSVNLINAPADNRLLGFEAPHSTGRIPHS